MVVTRQLEAGGEGGSGMWPYQRQAEQPKCRYYCTWTKRRNS